MDIAVLLEKNPWWRGKEQFESDPDYLKWLEKRIRWTPKIVTELWLEPFALHFIFGPRQVGKTTALKLLIKQLLAKRDPKSIFYFRCDEIADYKELTDLLRTYLEFREAAGIKSSVILLDEITFPIEWWRAIKGAIDDGPLKGDVLILTGSASLEVKKEREYFPGRRGGGRDWAMWPLSFREFVEITAHDLAERLTGQPAKDILYLKELNKALLDYFACGGFPLAINSYFERGYVEDSVKTTYLSWLKGDLAKVGRSERIARELLKVILTKLPSAISWEGVSKEMAVKSPKTVAAYLRLLADLFILTVAYFMEPHSASIKFAKNKKIHFIDPLYFYIFEDWCLVKLKEREAVIAECALAAHLFRAHKEVFYWANREEVDCVVRAGARLVGYESKWQAAAAEKRLAVGKLKQTWTLSKKDLRGTLLPLSLFLYSIREA